MSEGVSIDALVTAYVRIRNAKRVASKEWDDKKAQFDENLRRIENELLRRSHEEGCKSYATDAGTAYQREEVHSSIADPEEFQEFLAEAEDPYGFYEQRPSLKRVKEYMKAHEGSTPPGIRVFREIRMGVRAKGEQDGD